MTSERVVWDGTKLEGAEYRHLYWAIVAQGIYSYHVILAKPATRQNQPWLTIKLLDQKDRGPRRTENKLMSDTPPQELLLRS